MKAKIRSVAAVLLTIVATQLLPVQRAQAQTALVQLQPTATGELKANPETGARIYIISAAQFRASPTLALSAEGYRLQSLQVSMLPHKGSYQEFAVWKNREDANVFTANNADYIWLLQSGAKIFIDHIIIRDADGKELPEQSLVIVLQ